MKPYLDESEYPVEIKRTEGFDEATNKLSDYISTLHLSPDQNNGLIKLMLTQIKEAERGAFETGVSIGVGVTKEAKQDTEKISFFQQ